MAQSQICPIHLLYFLLIKMNNVFVRKGANYCLRLEFLHLENKCIWCFLFFFKVRAIYILSTLASESILLIS